MKGQAISLIFLVLFCISAAVRAEVMPDPEPDDSAGEDSSGGVGRESGAVLSPDGKQLVYVKQVARLEDNPWGEPADDMAMVYMAWSPDEIWTAEPDGSEARPLVTSRDEEDRYQGGWFSRIHFSPDSQKIYYNCNPCSPTSLAVRSVNRDGTDNQLFTYGSIAGVVGGEETSRWHGYVLVMKGNVGSEDIPTLVAPWGSEGVVIPTLADYRHQAIADFWKDHPKVESSSPPVP